MTNRRDRVRDALNVISAIFATTSLEMPTPRKTRTPPRAHHPLLLQPLRTRRTPGLTSVVALFRAPWARHLCSMVPAGHELRRVLALDCSARGARCRLCNKPPLQLLQQGSKVIRWERAPQEMRTNVRLFSPRFRPPPLLIRLAVLLPLPLPLPFPSCCTLHES